jgi:hypothetical protein
MHKRFSPMIAKTSLSALLTPLLAALVLLAGQAQAADAGVIVAASGNASIVSADGRSRPATAGAAIKAGETAETGEDAKLNIRFSDDSVVQLYAKSQFRIDQYAFSGGKSDDDKGFFSLVKGGFRTVTGLLGKFNRPVYRVSTVTATIGIRGTEYSARLDNGLHVQVDRGEISLTNKAGTFPVSEGQRAYVASQKSAPRYLKLGSAAQNTATVGRSGATGGGTNIQGNTAINANAANVNAVGIGQDNTASNKVGTIGGK